LGCFAQLERIYFLSWFRCSVAIDLSLFHSLHIFATQLPLL